MRRFLRERRAIADRLMDVSAATGVYDVSGEDPASLAGPAGLRSEVLGHRPQRLGDVGCLGSSQQLVDGEGDMTVHV
jgi:hypothetical protein